MAKVCELWNLLLLVTKMKAKVITMNINKLHKSLPTGQYFIGCGLLACVYQLQYTQCIHTYTVHGFTSAHSGVIHPHWLKDNEQVLRTTTKAE